MFYVYEWFDVKSGEIIYVGKGTKRRYKVRKHNKLFNECIAKSECDSRIIAEFSTEEEAFLYEQERISNLKNIGEAKCNIYEGGFGGSVGDWTEEKRKYYSEHNVMKFKEQRKRMSINNPMKNTQVVSKVVKQKVRPVVIDGEFYNSIKEAATALGVNIQTIAKWCKQGHSLDWKPCRYADEMQKEFEILTPWGKRVIVDGKRYQSVSDAARFIEVWPESLIRAIKKGRPCKGHICRYDNQQPSCEKPSNSIAEGSTTNE